MIRSVVFTILLVVASTHLHAQRKLSFAPGINFFATQCYILESNKDEETLRANNFLFHPKLHLGLQLNIKDRWIFFTGMNFGRLWIAIKYGEAGGTQRPNNATPVSNYLFGIQKHVHTHRWLKMDASANPRYMLLFRSRFLLGTSYDRIGFFGGNLNDRKDNISVLTGLSLQFFHDRGDMFQINFVYSHGLNEIAILEEAYNVDGTNYLARVGSRGSHFGVQFVYPLQLLQFR
jgi:hypothetical protein